MTDTRTARKIALLMNTLSTNADVLSADQVASLNATIASLKATGEAFPGATAARAASKGKATGTATTNPRQVIVAAAPAVKAAAAVIDVKPVAVETVPVPALKPVASLGTMPTLAGLLTGHAKFDASSPDGKVFTFEIAKPDNFRGEFFASVFSGEANKFTYIGMMKADGSFRLTKGSKLTADDVQTKVLVWALGKIKTGAALPVGYTIAARTTSPKAPTVRRGWRGYRSRWNPLSGASGLRSAGVIARNMGVSQ